MISRHSIHNPTTVRHRLTSEQASLVDTVAGARADRHLAFLPVQSSACGMKGSLEVAGWAMLSGRFTTLRFSSGARKTA